MIGASALLQALGHRGSSRRYSGRCAWPPPPGAPPTAVMYMAIQCATCGLVVGTHEGLYLSARIAVIADTLGIEG